MQVFGAGGVELNEEWGGDAQAYLGMTVPGFPNFFLLYGPNTNLVINGSILIMVECQVRYAVEAIGQMLHQGYRTMSCRRDVHERYGLEMEEGNARMVWGVADVPTWYRNARGRVTQNWPFDLHTYSGPYAPARLGRLRSALTSAVPSRLLTEILALVPDDFADPDADYRAVRAMLAPFHGHPVPAHVTVTDGELGGVRCAWYEDSRQPPRARRVPLPRRRARVVPARRLPLLRGHAGRAARGAGRDGRLPPCPRALLSRGAPGLRGRL